MPNAIIRPGLAGAAATFAGIGLARFAYTPLVPAMIEAGWFSAEQTAYLGAANLLGYLLGAVAAHRLAGALGTRRCLRSSFVLVVLSFLLCALPAPFAWFALWRLAAGAAGAVLMVTGASAAIAAVPTARRVMVAARVFTGIGIGTLLSAVLVPALLRIGLPATWFALGLGAIGAALAGWRLGDAGATGQEHATTTNAPTAVLAALTAATITAYALDAVGFVPHTVFWVDYLARGRSFGMDAAGLQWALFGIGTALGPMLLGWLAGRIGWRATLAAVLGTKTLVVGLPLLSPGLPLLALSSLVMGTLVLGAVTLTSGRLAEIVGAAAHRRVWGWATTAFALAQAAAGYGFAGLFALTGGYRALFAIAAAALAAATLLVCLNPRPRVAPAPREDTC